MDVINPILQTVVWGNTIHEYVISFLIVILTLLIAVAINRYLRKKLYDWADKTNTRLDDFIVNRIFPPIVYMVIIIGLAFAKSYLKFNPTADVWLDKILFGAGLAVFFLLVIRFAKGLVEVVGDAYVKKLELSEPEDLDEQKKTVERIKKQVAEILNMVLAILAILTILSNLGVDLKAIWASLGIGGIAIVVAVKDPLTNLVGRMYIYSTGIFDEGHFIVFNDIAGTVKRITIFRTYLEVFSDMTTVSVPNADFIKGIVKSYYGRTKFMFKWDLDVPYDVPAADIHKLIIALRELVHSKPEVHSDVCWIYLDRLDKFSKVVRVWFQASLPDWAASLFYGNRMLHEIQELFESMSIHFAFPTQTVHLKTEDPISGRVDTAPIALPESVE